MTHKLGSPENPRHILGMSGGKDSSALVILMKNTRPEIFEKLELYFTDTGTELPEVYEYLDKMEKYLNKKIKRIKATVDSTGYKVVDGEDSSVPFDEILEKYKGFLPSPNSRYCTRDMKIRPMEKWIGQDHCYSYIGIRFDEPQREGYIQGKKSNIVPVYPFREDHLGINDIYKILEESVGLPDYYKWRTRSGCYFCFYQRRVEWAVLYHLYPNWFEDAKKYETQHKDGRKFTWVKDNPLEYIQNNSKEIIKRYIKKQYKKICNTEEMKYTLDEILTLVDEGKIKEFVDSYDLKRLHDADGENKDGCLVCTI